MRSFNERGISREDAEKLAISVLAVIAAFFIPTVTPDNEEHLNHAELAMVPGGTLTEG